MNLTQQVRRCCGSEQRSFWTGIFWLSSDMPHEYLLPPRNQYSAINYKIFPIIFWLDRRINTAGFFSFWNNILPPTTAWGIFKCFPHFPFFPRAPVGHQRLPQTWATRAHLPVLIQGWRGNISPSINSGDIQTFSICGLPDDFHCMENKMEGNDY